MRLLAAAEAADHDESFNLDGVTYRRFDPPARAVRLARCCTWLLRPNGTRFDVGATGADCFWGR
ncbi:hypothetical protein ACTMSW_29360 [Micromonospora sp. BQ11]|uniref:hypothetical protein n=1 Tax=Micromonospora sp. BQ11 TaxID=3452212 RepID=UPI003F8A9964